MFGPNTKRRSLRKSKPFFFIICWKQHNIASSHRILVNLKGWKCLCTQMSCNTCPPLFFFVPGTWVTIWISFQVCPTPQELWPDCVIFREKGKFLVVIYTVFTNDTQSVPKISVSSWFLIYSIKQQCSKWTTTTKTLTPELIVIYFLL